MYEVKTLTGFRDCKTYSQVGEYVNTKMAFIAAESHCVLFHGTFIYRAAV